MTVSRVIQAFCTVSLASVTAIAQDSSNHFYQAIRNNDLAVLRVLLKTADVNTKDKRGSTPLMYAAAIGSIDAMNMLVSAGAEVNEKNALDATALHWCAGDLAKVRLLVSKGADVNARSKPGRTPLIIAAAHDGASEIVRVLLNKGADISARDSAMVNALAAAADANDTATVRLLIEIGATVSTKDPSTGMALMSAAGHGNVEVVRLLLAKGADVNAVSPPEVSAAVKKGPVALGLFTPLLLASVYGGPETVQVLLDAGAKVNVQDVRGMTPLMLAVSSDRPDPRVVRLLLNKGADPSTKSKDGETVYDWAKKFANPKVLRELGMPATAAVAPTLLPAVDRKPADPREAVQKSLALLQRTGGSFFNEGGCAGCHAQNLTGMAAAAAMAHGIRVDEAAVSEQLKAANLQWASFEQTLLQRLDPPGGAEMLAYSILQMAAANAPADRTIDAMIYNLAGMQRQDGRWHMGGVARPPMEDGDFGRTALSLRSLQHYTPLGRKAEFDQRIARAAAWLSTATPRTTEDRIMQLLGVKWANGTVKASRVDELRALQRPDGGWAQTPELASDAYATGQALYALHEVGLSVTDASYRHGVEYLLRTQLDDGSWLVASRAPRIQPYFQSGFPHDHNQWISSAATAWASMALSCAVPEKSLSAAR